MGEYEDLMRKIIRNIGLIGKENAEHWEAFQNLLEVCEKDGVLSKKVKELISVALAVKSQCKSCIVLHVKNAMDAGATRAEILEAAWVAVLMGGGPALMYLQHVMEALNEFEGKGNYAKG